MRKTLRIKKKYRKWVLRKNLPVSHQCPKTYRKSEKMFEEILKKFRRKSEKISKKIWEIFLPGELQIIEKNSSFTYVQFNV